MVVEFIHSEENKEILEKGFGKIQFYIVCAYCDELQPVEEMYTDENFVGDAFCSQACIDAAKSEE